MSEVAASTPSEPAPALRAVVLRFMVLVPLLDQAHFSAFIATLKQPELAMLAELLREGKVKPVIDRTYWSGKTADAIRYLEEGHTHGKIVVAFE